jgi:hypothetical protein
MAEREERLPLVDAHTRQEFASVLGKLPIRQPPSSAIGGADSQAARTIGDIPVRNGQAAGRHATLVCLSAFKWKIPGAEGPLFNGPPA